MLMEDHTCVNISLTEILQEGNVSVLCLKLTSDTGAFNCCNYNYCFNYIRVIVSDIASSTSLLFPHFFYVRFLQQICVLLLFFSQKVWIFSHVLKIFLKIVHMAESLTPATE